MSDNEIKHIQKAAIYDLRRLISNDAKDQG